MRIETFEMLCDWPSCATSEDIPEGGSAYVQGWRKIRVEMEGIEGVLFVGDLCPACARRVVGIFRPTVMREPTVSLPYSTALEENRS